MNEELRSKLPKHIEINGVKGRLFKSSTYFAGVSEDTPRWVTDLTYRFWTKELNEKYGIEKKQGETSPK